MVSQCHCEFCKRISGGYGTVSGRVRSDAIRILEGQELLRSYTPEGGSAKTFCSTCGSNLFGGAGRSPRWRRCASARSVSISTASPKHTRSYGQSQPGSSFLTTACRGTRSAPPEMSQRIVPMIAYEDAAAAIDWLSDAFGFTERVANRYTDESGVVGHAELELGGEIVHARHTEPRLPGAQDAIGRNARRRTAGSTIRGSSTASSSRSTISTRTTPEPSLREQR